MLQGKQENGLVARLLGHYASYLPSVRMSNVMRARSMKRSARRRLSSEWRVVPAGHMGIRPGKRPAASKKCRAREVRVLACATNATYMCYPVMGPSWKVWTCTAIHKRATARLSGSFGHWASGSVYTQGKVRCGTNASWGEETP